MVIGGGHVAERKVKGLLAHGAKVLVISPELTPELERLAQEDVLEVRRKAYENGDLSGAFLVIAATDDPIVQGAVFEEAEADNILLNVADVPKWCNFILPATTRQGDLAISISTAGKSPALASKLRQDFDRQFGAEFSVLVNILGNLREFVLARGLSHTENKDVFGSLAKLEMAEWIKAGEWDKVKAHINDVLGEVPEDVIRTAQEEYQQQV